MGLLPKARTIASPNSLEDLRSLAVEALGKVYRVDVEVKEAVKNAGTLVKLIDGIDAYFALPYQFLRFNLSVGHSDARRELKTVRDYAWNKLAAIEREWRELLTPEGVERDLRQSAALHSLREDQPVDLEE